MAQIVTITNPLTGQPAQVDQLDHTAQQIDDGLNIARGVSNPNLLDNWYFANPVDQRGGYVVPPGKPYYIAGNPTPAGYLSGYTTVEGYINDGATPVVSVGGTKYVCNNNTDVRGYTGAGYGIDRWKLEDSSNTGVVLINADGSITLINPRTDDNIWFTQYAENNFDSTKRIASTLIVDKQGSALLYSGVSTGKVLSIGINSFETTATDNIAARFVVNPNSSITIKAIKLELGTTQTLAHQDSSGNWVLNELPNYADALSRCQRYLWIPSPDLQFLTHLQDGLYKATVVFPVEMRTTPSITATSNTGVFNFAPFSSGFIFDVGSNQGTIRELKVTAEL